MWKNIKKEYPSPNSEIVVCYYFCVNDDGERNFGVWTSEIIHEKMVDKIETDRDIYWLPLPEELKNEI